jgi:hypothetical protein
MSKFHINKHGVPAPCKAKPGNCPLGGDETHFNSLEEAQVAINRINEEEHGIIPGMKTKPKEEVDQMKNIKSIGAASEHKKGWYEKFGKKLLGYYTYIHIETEDLGSFYLSFINDHIGFKDLKTDGYPWEFLMEDTEFKLTKEQIEFVNKYKDKILEEV